MLHYGSQTFRAGKGIAVRDVQEYLLALVARGYLARRGYSLIVPASGGAAIAGILCHPTALSDAAEDAVLLQRFKRIRVGSTVVQTSASVPGTRHDRYCRHAKWKALKLECNPLLGLSSVICKEDGGTVARYRLHLPRETEEQLWLWECQFDHIYELWLLSGQYEKWAWKQLHDSNSEINRLGAEVASRLAQHLACEIEYAVHRADGSGHS